MSDKPILEKEFNENLDIERYLREGSILARIFIEVQGNDKDTCQKALERTIFDSLADEDPVKLINVKFYELKRDDVNKFFSGVVEVKLLFRDFRWFISVVMRYGPSAMEIIEPHSVKLNLDEMQSIIADVSELSQTFSSQILSLLKDDERKAVYDKMLKGT
ncbi:MAG: hypothetical protein U9Q22_05865 [Candidatus Altiarchaeota archaeon]|nr:hypothetical protein [Candidatus Altiarchaeota archaeon]